MTASNELARILPPDLDAGQVSRSLKIYSSRQGPLGETFVVLHGARWIALTRPSMLEDFVLHDLDPDRPFELARSEYDATLTLLHASGEDPLRLEISPLDLDRVEDFVGDARGEPARPTADLEPIATIAAEISSAGPDLGESAALAQPVNVEAPDEGDDGDRSEAEEADHDEDELERDDGDDSEDDDDEYEDEEDDESDEEADADDDGDEAVGERQVELSPRLEGELIAYLRMGHQKEAVERLMGEYDEVQPSEARRVVELVAREYGIVAPPKVSNTRPIVWIGVVVAAVVLIYRLSQCG